MGSAWAACQDVGKKHAAIVAGCMNTIGNLGGAAATWLTGTILGLSRDAYAQAHGLNLDALKADPAQASALKEALKNGLLPGYQINFIIFAVVYAIAVFLWLGIDATKPVLPEDAADTGVRAG
jgi:MFS transporter, ACS family, glucarate transporter